jgi:hypothetical protein
MVMGAGLVRAGWSGNSHGWDGQWHGLSHGCVQISTKYVVKDRVSRDVHLHPNFCRGQNDILSRACCGNGWSLVMAADEELNDRQLGERWSQSIA